MKYLLWLALAALPVQAELLTLPQAVTQALQAAPALAVSQAETRIRAGELTTATIYPYQPNLDLNGGFRNSENDPVIRADLGLALSYPIETGGQQNKRVATAEAKLRLEADRFSLTRAQVSQGVALAYAQLWTAQELLKIAQRRTTISEQLYKAQQEQFKVGKISQLTLNLGQAELTRAQGEALIRAAELQQAQQQLRTAIGDLGSTPLEVAPLPTLPTFENSPSLAQAPQTRVAQAVVTVAQAERALTETTLQPTVTPTVSYRREGLDNVVFAGVSLPLSFINRDEGAIPTAQARLERAQAEARLVDQTLHNQIQAALLTLKTAQQGINTYQTLVGARETNLSQLQEAFKFGKASLFELLLAQRDTLEVQANLVQRQADAFVAYSTLRTSLGEDL